MTRASIYLYNLFYDLYWCVVISVLSSHSVCPVLFLHFFLFFSSSSSTFLFSSRSLPSQSILPLLLLSSFLRVTGTTLTSPLWTACRTHCPIRCILKFTQWWSSWFTSWSLWPSFRCITTTSPARSSRAPTTCREKSANTLRDRWPMDEWVCWSVFDSAGFQFNQTTLGRVHGVCKTL